MPDRDEPVGTSYLLPEKMGRQRGRSQTAASSMGKHEVCRFVSVANKKKLTFFRPLGGANERCLMRLAVKKVANM